MILIFIMPYAILVLRKEVITMKCDYKDDFKVDYTGELRITKGDGVDLVVKGDEIPANFKACLDSAVTRNSCHELRAAARGVTNTIRDALNRE